MLWQSPGKHRNKVSFLYCYFPSIVSSGDRSIHCTNPEHFLCVECRVTTERHWGAKPARACASGSGQGVISRVNRSCDIWAALLSGSAQLALGIEGHQEQEVRCLESDRPSLLCCLWLLLGLELIFFKIVPTSSSLMSQDTTLWSQVSKVQVPSWDAIVYTLCLATSYPALRSQHRHSSSLSPIRTVYDLGPTRMTGPEPGCGGARL